MDNKYAYIRLEYYADYKLFSLWVVIEKVLKIDRMRLVFGFFHLFHFVGLFYLH